jgi:hypothetical protein
MAVLEPLPDPSGLWTEESANVFYDLFSLRYYDRGMTLKIVPVYQIQIFCTLHDTPIQLDSACSRCLEQK